MRLGNVFKRSYHPLNKILISKNRLCSNYYQLRKLQPNINIAPVLKSNAYGHGIKEVAPILDKLNSPFFCVDSLYEAYELKKLRVKTPILIMGYVSPDNLKIKKLPFSYAIYDFKQAEVLNNFQNGAKIHIKVDTGMHRLGISLANLEDLVQKLKTLKNVEIEGLMSHFSSPKTSTSYTDFQIKNYKIASNILEKQNIKPKWKHIAASGGLLKAGSKINEISNLARVGISLFGLYRSNNIPNIQPILRMTTEIVQLKKLKRGEYVGYDKAFKAEKDTVLAVLPIGYNDGVDRRLTNVGFVKVKNKFARVIGKVSMNITTIDVTGLKTSIGDTVEVFSWHAKDKNSVEQAAEICSTIPHDLLVHLHSSAVRREVTP